jgi:hypothetical protein
VRLLRDVEHFLRDVGRLLRDVGRILRDFVEHTCCLSRIAYSTTIITTTGPRSAIRSRVNSPNPRPKLAK